MNRRTIFIVDDSAMVVTALKMAIESPAWSALGFSSLEALETFTRLEDIVPDIILTDYSLQRGATGLDVIEFLTNHFGADIPALVLSGVVTPSDINKIREAGHTLLFKSSPPEELISAIEAAIDPPAH